MDYAGIVPIRLQSGEQRDLLIQWAKATALAFIGLTFATVGGMLAEDASRPMLFRLTGIPVILFGMLFLILFGMNAYMRWKDLLQGFRR